LRVGQGAGCRQEGDGGQHHLTSSKPGTSVLKHQVLAPVHQVVFWGKASKGPRTAYKGRWEDSRRTGKQLAWLSFKATDWPGCLLRPRIGLVVVLIPRACLRFVGLAVEQGEGMLTKSPAGSDVCAVGRLFDYPPVQQPLSKNQTSYVWVSKVSRCNGMQAPVCRQFDLSPLRTAEPNRPSKVDISQSNLK